MKKLSEYQRLWLRHHAFASNASRLASKARRRLRRNATRTVELYSQGQRIKVPVAKTGTPLPTVLCFEKNFDETAQFLADLGVLLCRNAVRDRRFRKRHPSNRTWNDFSTLKYVSPAAGLVLAAEFDRAKTLAGVDRLFTIDMHLWDKDVRATLVELGFMPLLGIENTPTSARPPGSTAPYIVPFRSAETVDMSIASEVLKDVIRLAGSAAIIQVGTDPLQSFRTFLTAIGEALNNIGDHAYPAGVPCELPNVGRWWISGSVDPVHKRLRFTVYDQGVTIPRAIPLSRNYGAFRRFMKRMKIVHDPGETAQDGAAIAAAVRVGVSGTKLSHRGHGLALMRDYIKTERLGSLRIVSRNGEYVAETGKKDRVVRNPIPLFGTLIEWNVDL